MNEDVFRQRTGFIFKELFCDTIAKYLEAGFIEQTVAGYTLSREALSFSDSILADFILSSSE